MANGNDLDNFFHDLKNLLRKYYEKFLKQNGKMSEKDEKEYEKEAKSSLLDFIREVLNSGKNYQDSLNELRQRFDTLISSEEDKPYRPLLKRARLWLEDELILICPQSPTYLKELKTRVGQGEDHFILRDFRPSSGAQYLSGRNDPLILDIEFKSEYVKHSKRYTEPGYKIQERDPISLVAQCMFVVMHEDGVLYTLHDRSFSGGDDRTSKYAMITGRLSKDDIHTSSSLADVCLSTLCRELQEEDELGLPKDVAEELTGSRKQIDNKHEIPRHTLVKCYKSANNRVISILFLIRVRIVEYNEKLTSRGPSLIPVTPKEYSLFHRLDLLNDILKHNSCNRCLRNVKLGLRDKQGDVCIHNSEVVSCIIRDISHKIGQDSLDYFDNLNDHALDENIHKYRTCLGEDSAIVAIDVPEYSRLDAVTIRQLRLNLEMFIKGFFSSDAKHTCTDQKTPTGYLLIIQSKNNEQVRLALIAYFFAIYLSMKLVKNNSGLIEINAKLAEINNESEKLNLLPTKPVVIDKQPLILLPDVRLALHMSSLPSFDDNKPDFFTGNGINQVLDIVEVGQPQQILGSLSFVMHLLEDLDVVDIHGIEHHPKEDVHFFFRKVDIAKFKADLAQLLKKLDLPNNITFELYDDPHPKEDEDPHPKKDEDLHLVVCKYDPAKFLEKANLAQLLQGLDLPNDVMFSFYNDNFVTTCYRDHGLPIRDFGFFVQGDRLRFRVFNLGIFNEPGRSEYGNRIPPTARIPIVSRNKDTTLDEMERLINGIKYAEHLMMNGYSNVRMMREILKTYVLANDLPVFLKSFKIIFGSFDQFNKINEKRKLVITQANWVRGFLYAQYIALALNADANGRQENGSDTKVDTKIAINSSHYGFNVLKIAYAARHEYPDKTIDGGDYRDDYRDNIRFTVLMPGDAFELSPVFIINRGDPFYHSFLEISERYVEEGVQENRDELSVSKYEPGDQGKQLLNRIFSTPDTINGVGPDRYNELVTLLNNKKMEELAKQAEVQHDPNDPGRKPPLGEYYTDLLAENDFAEAFRLMCCIEIVESQAKWLPALGFSINFNVRDFLTEFTSRLSRQSQ